MRLLGLIINKRYNWKDHIEYLITSLSKRLNVLKCFGNTKWNCKATNLLSVSKALLMSKINYGLQFFGYAPKSQINKINSVINTSLRISLGALRSTPISNLRFETDLRSLNIQRDILTTKLYRTVLYNDNNLLEQIVKKIKASKKIPKVPSTLYRMVQNCNILDIPLHTSTTRFKRIPPWFLNKECINLSLSYFYKDNTSDSLYRTMFLNLKEEYNDHKIIFTDGSKTNNSVTYSVTTENSIIKVCNVIGTP